MDKLVIPQKWLGFFEHMKQSFSFPRRTPLLSVFLEPTKNFACLFLARYLTPNATKKKQIFPDNLYV